MDVLQYCYCINLANGHRWQFLAVDQTSALLAKMAETMRLGKCRYNDSPKIIFIPGDHSSKEPGTINPTLRLFKSLPQDGWVSSIKGYNKIWQHPAIPDVIHEVDHTGGEQLDGYRLLYALYSIYQDVVQSGGLPIHASLIERNGAGFLLAARSGTGKSTCCKRLVPPWKAICDEEVLIVPSEVGYRVHPFPTWSDHIERNLNTSWDVQQHLPLSGIFLLEQAEQDRVMPVSNMYAVTSLLSYAGQINRRYFENSDSKSIQLIQRHMLDNACAIVHSVPVFKLQVYLHGKYWEEIDQVISKVSSRKSQP